MRIAVGIDENGLGPRLGPLVITAITAQVQQEAFELVQSKPPASLANRLGDSKQLVSFGQSLLGEAWARGFAHRAGLPVCNPDELLRAFLIDSKAVLQQRCPPEHTEHCWGTKQELFRADHALVRTIEGDFEQLNELGIDVQSIDVVWICPERLNHASAQGLSRLHVDLHAMERLALTIRSRTDTDLWVTCGKVGGFNRYQAHFGPLSRHLCTPLEEGRARSEYAVAGLGRLSFVRDVDAHHLLVCMASLVGKWIRDLSMERILRYYSSYDPTLPYASGYHDPVTQRLIEASTLIRTNHHIPAQCFERSRVVCK